MILDRLRRKKKPKGPKLSRSEFLSLKPLRSPAVEWERNEKGEIKIIIPLKKIKQKVRGEKKETGKGGIFSKFFPEPEEKRIQLDEAGSTVWELCNGKNTIREIAEHLCKKYKLLQREAEIALGSYLDTLVNRGLIGFIVPENLKERFEKEKMAGKK